MGHHDWLAEVQRQLHHTGTELRETPRGAYTLRSPHVHVLYGNRGDDEVLLLRRLLPEVGTDVLAHGDTPREPRWAMIVRSRLPVALLAEIVCTAHDAVSAAGPATLSGSSMRRPVSAVVNAGRRIAVSRN